MILFFDGDSSSVSDAGIWIKSIREYVEKEELISVKIGEDVDWNRVCRFLEDAQAIVLAADVYMDSVSPRVLGLLERIEQAVIGGESISAKFYAILHTDLYEGEQTSIAMAVLKNFCEHANITWGRGLGIGGNNLKAALQGGILWKRPDREKTDFRLPFLHEHALFIREKMQGADVYICPDGVSRGQYIRQNNRQNKKNNRVKVAEY